MFWTIAWPALWVVLVSVVLISGVPGEILPQTRGAVTISMMGLGLITSGIVNLAGSIAGDKERGIHHKFVSTPLKAWEDALGRLMGLFVFAFVGSMLVLIVGVAIGARFSCALTNILQSIGYGLLILLSSGGIGVIFGSMIAGEGAATHIGVGVTVVTASISGLFTPYSTLPDILKRFAEYYPPSSAIASIIQLLEGEHFVGYNPLTPEHVLYTMISSTTLFILGLAVYRQKIWASRL